MTLIAFALIDFDKPDLKLFRHFDWSGLVFMAVPRRARIRAGGGPRNDWFGTRRLAAAWISGPRGVRVLRPHVPAREPIVDLKAFADRNFALARCSPSCSASASTGSPICIRFTAQIRGYNALMIGEALFVTGLAQFATALIAGRLMTRLDPRIMLVAGFVLFAAGTCG